MKIDKITKSEFDVVITMSKEEVEKLVYALGHIEETGDPVIDLAIDCLYDSLKGFV